MGLVIIQVWILSKSIDELGQQTQWLTSRIGRVVSLTTMIRSLLRVHKAVTLQIKFSVQLIYDYHFVSDWATLNKYVQTLFHLHVANIA